MRRTLCRVNAADAGCVSRGGCELVCAFTPRDRNIGHTVGSTCVYVRKLRGILLHISRSPRWTSGSPRMLLVLVREFESRRGEILNLFPKIKKAPAADSA